MTLFELYGMYLSDIAFWRIVITCAVICTIGILIAIASGGYDPAIPIAICVVIIIFTIMSSLLITINRGIPLRTRDTAAIQSKEDFRGWVASYYPDHIDLLKPKALEVEASKK